MIILLILIFSSCKIGSKSYAEPWEIDETSVYSVVYDALGGTINTLGTRTVYYSGGSLIKEPQGSSGMITKPVFGNKVVLSWYTAYENRGTKEAPVYYFNEENKWNFDTDRISDENTDENKRITLYACWIEPPTIYFVDADNKENIIFKWSDVDVKNKMSRPTNAAKTTLERAEGGTKVVYTLLDYYFNPECTEKVIWGENSRSIEEIIADQGDKSEIYIYCKYIKGEYIRIQSASEIKSIKDFNGKYILANDIDMGKGEWTTNDSDNPFSGIFIGNGYTISNINITAVNRVSGIAYKTAKEKSFGLFSNLSGATFDGLNFKNVTISVGATSNVKLCAGVFGGRATNTVFKNCKIEDYRVISDGKVTVELYLGTAAYSDYTCTEIDCVFPEPNIDQLKIDDGKLIIDNQSSKS